jgi:hypothetical protein
MTTLIGIQSTLFILNEGAKERAREMAKKWRALCERYPAKIAVVA